MPDKSIDEIVKTLFDVRTKKAAMDKEEKALVAELKPLVDPHFDIYADLGLPVSNNKFILHSGDLDLSRISGTSRTLSADLLLERGVSPDIIQSATKVTSYNQYRIVPAKSAEEKQICPKPEQ